MQNEWVLITGASSGIGLELAKIFATHRFHLVLLARNEQRLQELARELTAQHGIKTKILAKDLTSSGVASEIFSELQRESIPISILVNNAGFGFDSLFLEENLKTFSSMVQVNVTALVELTHLFAQPMVARRQGKILNVASTAAFQPGPLMAVYYASKSFVLSFSYALANELDGSGVTVTTLCPGPTRSEFHARAGTTRSAAMAKWMMTAESVAQAGFDGLMKSRRVVIPGTLNKVGAFLAKIAPIRLTSAISRKVIEG